LHLVRSRCQWRLSRLDVGGALHICLEKCGGLRLIGSTKLRLDRCTPAVSYRPRTTFHTCCRLPITERCTCTKRSRSISSASTRMVIRIGASLPDGSSRPRLADCSLDPLHVRTCLRGLQSRIRLNERPEAHSSFSSAFSPTRIAKVFHPSTRCTPMRPSHQPPWRTLRQIVQALRMSDDRHSRFQVLPPLRRGATFARRSKARAWSSPALG
jgi:hypothetical protein